MSNVVKVAAAIIRQDDKVLIAKRPKDKHKGGYWEFPGGKIESNETATQALQREILEELAITIELPVAFHKLEFSYPEKTVELDFYLVESFSGEPQGLEGQEICWANIDSLSQFKFPEANVPVVDKLLSSTV